MKYEWGDFFQRFSISQEQKRQLERYYELLVDWNSRMNLTALTDFVDVREYHFADSLYLSKVLDLTAYTGLVDVGTGAGFPAVPLKILYPQMPVILIEVLAKRRLFLQAVIEELGLSDVIISEVDWRTFLHTTKFPHNLFCARASLRPDELSLMFAGKSPYKRASLIYWAADSWKPEVSYGKYIRDVLGYRVGNRQRKYVLLSRS